jgi:hypothetical protein
MQYPIQKNNTTDATIIITIYAIVVGVIIDKFIGYDMILFMNIYLYYMCKIIHYIYKLNLFI